MGNESNKNNNNNTSPEQPKRSDFKETQHGPALEAVKKANNNNNNNNNKKQKESTAVSESKEMTSIPTSDLEKLVTEINTLKIKNVELKRQLDRIGGALIQVQASVHNTKNSIPS